MAFASSATRPSRPLNRSAAPENVNAIEQAEQREHRAFDGAEPRARALARQAPQAQPAPDFEQEQHPQHETAGKQRGGKRCLHRPERIDHSERPASGMPGPLMRFRGNVVGEARVAIGAMPPNMFIRME